MRCSPFRGLFVEQVVLDRLDAVVERLDGLEVSVDDDVEQPVHQRADTVLLAAQLIETLRYGIDVELRRQPDRDQSPRQHETRDPVDVQHRLGVVLGQRILDRHAVHGEEGVRPVDDRLGAFRIGDRVLHRPAVELELVRPGP